MNTRLKLVAGFIDLTCFVFTAGACPSYAEDDTNKVRWDWIVGIFAPTLWLHCPPLRAARLPTLRTPLSCISLNRLFWW